MLVDLYCPFRLRLNPHVRSVQRQTVAWARSFSLLKSESQYCHLAASQIGWLVARAFPSSGQEGLQIAADWATLFCLLDDRVEDPRCAPDDLAASLSRLLQSFKNNETEDDPAAHALLDLRARALSHASPGWVARFAEKLEELFTAHVCEARNRAQGITPDFEEYCAHRRITSGLYAQLELVEISDGIRLPDEVRQLRIFHELTIAASNCIGWENDLFTWEKETETGEVHNLLTVLMQANALSLAQAAEQARELHDAEVRRFLELETQLPFCGAADADVRRYVEILRCCLRGHIEWSRETARYETTAKCNNDPITI
jgi:5-epi-alpha-selinene synthase